MACPAWFSCECTLKSKAGETLLFVIDVGNTNIVLGVYQGHQLIHHWRLHTNRNATEDEYAMLIKNLLRDAGLQPEQLNGVVLSSVVPSINNVLDEMCHKYFRFPPLIIGPGIRTGLNIKIENPREVGSDRIVNAVAAADLYGTPVIVVDFGTATTFCLVDQPAQYLGGVIAPGMGVSSEALVSRAAQLTRFEVVKPDSVVGKNTIKAMQSGLYFGLLGQVDGIVRRLQQEVNEKATVVATGGLAELIYSDAETIDKVNPLLTLHGLYLIYQRNS